MRIQRSCDYSFKPGLDIIFSSSLALNLDDFLFLQFLFCLSRTQVRSFGRLGNICWNLNNPLCGPRQPATGQWCLWLFLIKPQSVLSLFFFPSSDRTFNDENWITTENYCQFYYKRGTSWTKTIHQLVNSFHLFVKKRHFHSMVKFLFTEITLFTAKWKKLTSSPHGENNYDE